MKQKQISIKLAHHTSSVAPSSYEIVSMTNAISVEMTRPNSAAAHVGDYISAEQAQGLIDCGCYEIHTIYSQS